MPVQPDSIPSPNVADVREFIASTADELAQLARQSGDRRLALILDAAASIAELPEVYSASSRAA